MENTFAYVAENFVWPLIVIGIAALAGLMWQSRKMTEDTNKIISLLDNGDYDFRSTHAIASNTNLSEDRVRALCSKNRQIRRNENEKESWTLQ